MINKVLQIKDVVFEMLTLKQGDILIEGNNKMLEKKYNAIYMSNDSFLPEFLTGYEYIKLMCDMYDYQCDYEALKKLIEYYSMQKNMNFLLETYNYDMINRIQLICAFMIKPEVIIINDILDDLCVETIEKTKILIRDIVQKNNTVLLCNRCREIIGQIQTHIMIIHKGKIYET